MSEKSSKQNSTSSKSDESSQKIAIITNDILHDIEKKDIDQQINSFEKTYEYLSEVLEND